MANEGLLPSIGGSLFPQISFQSLIGVCPLELLAHQAQIVLDILHLFVYKSTF